MVVVWRVVESDDVVVGLVMERVPIVREPDVEEPAFDKEHP